MANWPLWQPFCRLSFGCSCLKRLHSSADPPGLLLFGGTSPLTQNVQGEYIPLFHQRAPDSAFAKAGGRVYVTFIYPGVKVTESIDVERTMETRMDAIAVNLCDLLSPQMRMDGGILVVPIGRWMRAQPRL